ncbi:hypothetical protein M2360_004155 [Rhizobium sp. SG_E_25_P2]|jgi:hypothetical protein|uniref:hypothetical protein n=1 Tax=Rhizobium sp. SG_E_25_P2 TaxID=2879942 RepID=UPI002473B667|nr:hypothetical protein [Rhizobium sp. SG_E_25_P2]MDH6268737.1 hypothetical protein [Rhizobium sp. SG_E_25_P2]
MNRLRLTSLCYFLILLAVALLNYLPFIPTPDGRVFGIFALDIYDDALHLASALWAGGAALAGARASKFFLRSFGILYFADGALGLATGSGYLDLGILHYGVQDLPLTFKILANLPHLTLGGAAIATSIAFARDAK